MAATGFPMISSELIRRFQKGEITRWERTNVKSSVDSVMSHLNLPTPVEQAVRSRLQSSTGLTKSYIAKILLEESMRFNNTFESTAPSTLHEPEAATAPKAAASTKRSPVKVVSTFGLHI
jgi:hypothetical protein